MLSKNAGCFLIGGFVLLAICGLSFGQADQPLVAIIDASPISGPAPLSVVFDASRSTGDIMTAYWEFGDGGYAYGKRVVHTYNVQGTYVATLTVYDPAGNSAFASVTITVLQPAGQPPILTLYDPQINGLTVTINGVTQPGTPGTTITRIHWIWGDGSEGDYWFPASHTYREAGRYKIIVTSFQSDGLSTSSSVTVTLSEPRPSQPPSLDLFTPEIQGLTVRINGVALPGTPGTVISRIHWDWGDGFRGDQWFAASHTYASPGTYTVTVTAYQSDGLSTTRTVTVRLAGGQPPSLTLFDPEIRGLTVTINGVTSPGTPGTTIVRIQWDWGDGIREDRWFAASHTYSRPGTYTITVTSFQSDGLSTTRTVTVSLKEENKPPVADFSYSPSNPRVNETIQFTDRSYDPDGSITSWRWEFGDGSTSTLSNPSHSYSRPGTYTVWLYVTDNGGAAARVFKTITVGEANRPPYEPSNPYPPHRATEIPIGISLSWSGGDPDGDPVTYDIYFGTSSPPPLIARGHSSSTYRLPKLDYNTKYYWSITASDGKGGFTRSPTWEFTTGARIKRLERLAINGPTEVRGVSGNAVSYSCTAYFDDGTQEDVTNFATWGENFDSATISRGRLTVTSDLASTQRGEVTCSYTYNAVTKSASLSVTLLAIAQDSIFRGIILVDRPIISFYSFDISIQTILSDPSGKLRVGDTVGVGGHRASPAKVDLVTVGDLVEVKGVVVSGPEGYGVQLTEARHYVKRIGTVSQPQLIATELSILLEPSMIQEGTDRVIAVKGRLVRKDNMQGIAGKKIDILFSDWPKTAVTDSNGYYQTEYTVNLRAGSYGFRASFAGDSQYGPSSGAAILTVTPVAQEAYEVSITVTGLPSELTTRIYIDDKHEFDMRGNETKTIQLSPTKSHVITADKVITQSEFSRFLLLSTDRIVITQPQKVQIVYGAEYKLIQVLVVNGEIVDKSESWHQDGSLVPITLKERTNPFFLLAVGMPLLIKGVGTTLTISIAAVTIYSAYQLTLSMNQPMILPAAYGDPSYKGLVLGSLEPSVTKAFDAKSIKEYMNLAEKQEIINKMIEYKIKGVRKAAKITIKIKDLSKCRDMLTIEEAKQCIKKWIENEVKRVLVQAFIEEASGIDKLPSKTPLEAVVSEEAFSKLAEHIANKITEDELRKLIYERNQKDIFEKIGVIASNVIDSILSWIRDNICKFVEWILKRAICATAGSDVKLLLIDSKGRRVGGVFEESQWKEYNEIPRAWYSGLESYPQHVVLPDPEEGSFRFIITGKEPGEFRLNLTSIVEGSIASQQMYSGSIDRGKTQEYGIKLAQDGAIIRLGEFPPTPPREMTIEEALDENNNNIIDDPEILKAITYWISGEEVPGTDGQTIDDAKMLELLHIWTSRRPISSASAQSGLIQTRRTESLTVREIKLSPNPVKSTYTATFRAEGSGIAGIKVEVFNLAGMKVSEEEASGNTLRFYALDDRGRPLANGVYMYIVRVRGFDGREYVSEVRKLVILR